MHHASTRTEQVKHVYQFAGSISCIHCGLKLRCDTGNTPDNRRQYYRDAAKARRLPCPAGGNLLVRIDLVDEQFGDLLKSLKLPVQPSCGQNNIAGWRVGFGQIDVQAPHS